MTDDELEPPIDESAESDELGTAMRAHGYRESMPGDSDWVEVAAASDPIRIVNHPTR